MQTISYILSFSALVLMTLPSLLKGKNMKGILLLLCIGNGVMGINYLLSGGINGAVTSFIGVVTTLVNFTLEVKKKPVPAWLRGVYFTISIVMNLVISKGFTIGVLLVILAGLAYQMSVTSKSGKQYRFYIFFNLLIWCIYDIISASYGVLPTHATQLVINVASMLFFDKKK